MRRRGLRAHVPCDGVAGELAHGASFLAGATLRGPIEFWRRPEAHARRGPVPSERRTPGTTPLPLGEVVAVGAAREAVHVVVAPPKRGDEQLVQVIEARAKEFGVPDPELGFTDERRVAVGELLGAVGDRLAYTYDFGDDWQHEIVVEQLLVPDPEVH